MTRRPFGRRFGAFSSDGYNAFASAERSLDAGDKAEALQSFALAYNALSQSGSEQAQAKAKRAAEIAAELVADFRRAGIERPFGDACCVHSVRAGLFCALCDLARPKASPAALAKTEPEVSDAELLLAMVRERGPVAATIEDIDDVNETERRRKAGG